MSHLPEHPERELPATASIAYDAEHIHALLEEVMEELVAIRAAVESIAASQG
jgi:hypothetical protein